MSENQTTPTCPHCGKEMLPIAVPASMIGGFVCENHCEERKSETTHVAVIAERGAARELAQRLRRAAQTACNDDTTEAMSDQRARHVTRCNAMWDAADYLEELANG